MPLNRTNFNALVDDDHSNTVGTEFTKDIIKIVLLDPIDAELARLDNTRLVPVGGTGQTTLAAHGVVVGEGAAAVAVVSPGAAGTVLTSNGATVDPSFQVPANRIVPHELGGSRAVGIRSATWVAVAEWKHPYVDKTGYLSALVRVERRTTVITTTVTCRLIDVETGLAVGTGAAYNADTNWNEETFAVTLNPSVHHYELQIEGNNASADVFAMGRIELYAS